MYLPAFLPPMNSLTSFQFNDGHENIHATLLLLLGSQVDPHWVPHEKFNRHEFKCYKIKENAKNSFEKGTL